VNAMAFAKRKITLAIALATNSGTNQPNSFAESGTNTVTIENLRTNVRISNSGSPVDNRATVKVHGLNPSLMNQLSTLGLVFNLVPKNTLTIQAGDENTGMATVFSGTIFAAYGDYAAQPDVSFQFECLSGVADNVAPAPASSFTGSTSVETIMSGFARQLGLGFENNGVSIQLASPYFPGSVWSQARAAAEHANINWSVVDSKLSIWPKNGNRNTPNIATISKETGMVTSPAFTQQGVIVKTLFNPLISFGSLVKIESFVIAGIKGAQPASNIPSQWAVNKLDLALDALEPKGQWLSTIYAYNPNYAKAIIPPAGSGT